MLEFDSRSKRHSERTIHCKPGENLLQGQVPDRKVRSAVDLLKFGAVRNLPEWILKSGKDAKNAA
jgi:hypothetical protein